MPKTIFLLFSLFCFILQTSFSFADTKFNPITIENAWIRLAPPVVPALAAYLTIHNHSTTDIVLTKAESTDFNSIEFHRSLIKDGMAIMEAQNDLMIPAHGKLALAPSAYHLMLIKPKRALALGQTTMITLYFQNYPSIEVEFTVKQY